MTQVTLILGIVCLCAFTAHARFGTHMAQSAQYQTLIAWAEDKDGDRTTNQRAAQAVIEWVACMVAMVTGDHTYFIGKATGLQVPGAVGRRKRFASFGSSFGGFGSNSGWGNSNSGGWGNNNNAWANDHWSSGFGNSHPNNGHGHPHDHGHTHNGPSYPQNNLPSQPDLSNALVLRCPQQLNQSSVFNLNSTQAGYPSTEIGTELFIRSLPGSDLFFFCLARRAITPGQQPQVTVDDSLVTANSTCPSQDLSLFSYTSQANGGRCWVLQGFQEETVFSVCQTRQCVDCKLKGHERSTGYNQWNQNTWQPNHGHQTFSNITVNQCVTEYRTVQLIVYCEALPINARIVYDRVIIPQSCECKSVDCERDRLLWKKK